MLNKWTGSGKRLRQRPAHVNSSNITNYSRLSSHNNVHTKHAGRKTERVNRITGLAFNAVSLVCATCFAIFCSVAQLLIPFLAWSYCLHTQAHALPAVLAILCSFYAKGQVNKKMKLLYAGRGTTISMTRCDKPWNRVHAFGGFST